MKSALSSIQDYASRLYPVRGVCLDTDESEKPQDSSISVAQIRPGALAEIGATESPVNVPLQTGLPIRGYTREQTPFEFFLDGTRRTFLVAAMTTPGKKFLPVVAGQISAAVLRRSRATGAVSTMWYEAHNVVAVPSGGAGINQGDIQALRASLAGLSRPFRLLDYRAPQDRDPQEMAIARIHSEMQSLEVQALEHMTNAGLTGQSRMMIVDGSVQFTDIKRENYSWLRYVVGVSKTFNTRLPFFKDRTEIGVHLMDLRQVGDRTPAFRLNLSGRHMYAVWYMRIREQARTDAPLSGIIKVERLLTTDEERELGVSSNVVDNLSMALLGERYVTPYGNDSRWANHLYPIYLAEQLQKSRALSEIQFLRMI